MEKFEPKIDIQKTPENEISSLEAKDIPELKYENICENIWKDSEFIKQICKSFDINLRNWLEEKWINFQAML